MFNFSDIQTKYFWIAIVVIGSIGIWLPFLLGDPLHIENFALLITTYYVSIYFSGCLDSVMNKIKKSKDNSGDLVKKFLDVIGLILLSVALILSTVLFNQNKYHWVAIAISLVGTILALNLWWKNNRESTTFNEFIRKESNEKHGNDW